MKPWEYDALTQDMLQFIKDKRKDFVQDVNIEYDNEAQKVLGKTAFYSPTKKTITVYINARHPKDILRSIAHETIHHCQNCAGNFDDVIDELEPNYFQNNDKLRNMEEEAYRDGNMFFRDWEEQFKKKDTNNMFHEKKFKRFGRLIKG